MKPAKRKDPKPRKKSPAQRAPRTQYAALPWQVTEGGDVVILLATSRDTRRWVIPKGWPMKGRKPHIVAAIEAMQEAGLLGRIEKTKLGEFNYQKRLKGDATVHCLVEVFPLRVERQRKNWLEKGQRAIHWFPYETAAEQVDEPELRDIILAFGAALRA
jgi:8-oxo-dGTP pyrophosphatase MutT (NUDIX family)